MARPRHGKLHPMVPTEYVDLLSDALSRYCFPKDTFDFGRNEKLCHGDMRGVENYIGESLRSDDRSVMRNGLSNVLFWGYARREGWQHHKVCDFRQHVDDRQLVEFQEFVRCRPVTCAAKRLLALKKLQLPQFGIGMSFTTKILMFLDPDRYPVLDQKIAKAATANDFAPLQGLKYTVTETSIRITGANAAAYERWACWCQSIATWSNGQPGSPSRNLRAVDVERAIFRLADSRQMCKVRALLTGPPGRAGR